MFAIAVKNSVLNPSSVRAGETLLALGTQADRVGCTSDTVEQADMMCLAVPRWKVHSSACEHLPPAKEELNPNPTEPLVCGHGGTS